MNALRFINSKDIAKHLKEIGYQFNTLETSWLIYQCRTASLPEKKTSMAGGNRYDAGLFRRTEIELHGD